MNRPGKITFSLAGAGNDAEIRNLLRRSPMEGAVSLSLEREPDYFFESSHLPSSIQQTVIAKKEGRIVCVGQCSVRHLFLNGESKPVGYLGGLRLAPEMAGHYEILRQGYAFFNELSWPEPPELFFSSVFTDNMRARNFLERNLRGMPRYRRIADFVTVLIPVPRQAGPERESAEKNEPEEIAAWLNRNNSLYSLAPVWTAESLLSLEKLGLKMSDFIVQRTDGNISACAALWDQRSFKQTVIQKYDRRWAMLRPLLNSLFRFRGYPGLPQEGSTLANGFLSHLSIDSEQPGLVQGLVRSVFPRARKAGMEFLNAGFMEGDRRLTVIRRKFPHREYKSKLYHVSWTGAPFSNQKEIVSPETSLL